jgi:hypothetical protein
MTAIKPGYMILNSKYGPSYSGDSYSGVLRSIITGLL